MYRQSLAGHMWKSFGGVGLTAGAMWLVFVFNRSWTWLPPSSVVWASGLVIFGLLTLCSGIVLIKLRFRENFDYLRSDTGFRALTLRERVSKKLSRANNICLGTFVVLGSLFVLLFSAVGCENTGRGFCAAVEELGRPSDDVLIVMQLSALIALGCYTATTLTKTSYLRETDAVSRLVRNAEQNRQADPLSELVRSQWPN